jgi:hypothetical protein
MDSGCAVERITRLLTKAPGAAENMRAALHGKEDPSFIDVSRKEQDRVSPV